MAAATHRTRSPERVRSARRRRRPAGGGPPPASGIPGPPSPAAGAGHLGRGPNVGQIRKFIRVGRKRHGRVV